MIGGEALGSRALGDVARREMASEWGGPAPAATGAMPVSRDRDRRAVVRKP
jgi:hypothetical protein